MRFRNGFGPVSSVSHACHCFRAGAPVNRKCIHKDHPGVPFSSKKHHKDRPGPNREERSGSSHIAREDRSEPNLLMGGSQKIGAHTGTHEFQKEPPTTFFHGSPGADTKLVGPTGSCGVGALPCLGLVFWAWLGSRDFSGH